MIKQLFHNRLNEKGAILIAGYVVMFALVAISSSLSMFNFAELSNAKRNRDSTAAFWLAEAGLHQYLSKPDNFDKNNTEELSMGRGTVYIQRDDSSSIKRLVTSTGVVGSIKRSVQLEYSSAPGVFDRTMSIKGDLLILGEKTSLVFNDMVRLSGKVDNSSLYSSVFFEDKKENLNPVAVSIIYPDLNNNGITDEFNDFVIFNRELIKSYPENEVVYINGNDTLTITPDKSIEGKKLIFIEGDEGKGNVNIQFAGALAENQNLTIISTGTVTNTLAGLMNPSSQLNIIAWSGYKENTALPSSQKGVIFTHGKAVFGEIHDTSITNGIVVANQGVEIKEVWSTKTFNYVDTRTEGVVPPGFEGLTGGGASSYSNKANAWREIYL